MSRIINLEEEAPLRQLKTKTIYAPKGAFRVEGELSQGGQGAINGHEGHGFEVDAKQRLTLLDPDAMAVHRAKAKAEAEAAAKAAQAAADKAAKEAEAKKKAEEAAKAAKAAKDAKEAKEAAKS